MPRMKKQAKDIRVGDRIARNIRVSQCSESNGKLYVKITTHGGGSAVAVYNPEQEVSLWYQG